MMRSRPRVLVAYATRYGSTKGVAERIAETISEDLHRVDLCSVADAGDPGDYDAVVLGSPVYNGSWLPEAIEFVREHTEGLARTPVWFFSVGSLGDDHRLVGRLMRREPREMEEFKSGVHPRDYRVFAGAIERTRRPLPARVFFRLLGGRFGDMRDWPGIDAWAGTISDSLHRRPPVPVS